MKENLVASLGRSLGEELHRTLYGVDGERGILDDVTDDGYFGIKFVTTILSRVEPGPKREWLRKQEKQLYVGSSLESRLKAGLSHQQATTNPLENRNKFLKASLHHRRHPVQNLLKILFENHAEISQTLVLAIFGNDTEFVVRLNPLTLFQGKSLKHDEQVLRARQFGLQSLIPPEGSERILLPWLFDGRTGISKNEFEKRMTSIEFTKSTGKSGRYFADTTAYSTCTAVPFIDYDLLWNFSVSDWWTRLPRKGTAVYGRATRGTNRFLKDVGHQKRQTITSDVWKREAFHPFSRRPLTPLRTERYFGTKVLTEPLVHARSRASLNASPVRPVL